MPLSRQFFSVCVLLLSLFPKNIVAEPVSSPPSVVPGDRWMEIDLYWFEQDHIAASVDEFWDRFAPMYQEVQDYKGIVLNVGWTVNFIMSYSGDLKQRMVLPIGSGQQPWVDMNGALPGTTTDREREWKERFSHPHAVPRHGYGPWTYGDMKQLATLLRDGAERRGIHGFKVATLCYAWTNAYGEVAPFAKMHPEAWTQWGKHSTNDFTLDLSGNFDPAKRLHADTGKFAGMPSGIREGTPVHEAFAKQWGALSKQVGLDGLMLRDSFGFPTPYARSGPLGPVMPDPQTIQEMTDGVSAMIRELKQANPDALTMMYSNGASALSDWRSNGLDLERVAKEGYLDIFVDQTWAGSWNEVGVRHDLFWNTALLGWTYQFAYMLEHSAVLSGTKVRHYPLVETFDAWESWDIIHTVPQRLRWGIWQYSHAGVKTPSGIVMPQGTYISWANQGKRILSKEDVDFLRANIGASVRDAAQTKEIYGPTVVYSRDAMQYEAEHARADQDIKEWTDEQVGSVIKWPVPVLSITRAEWVPCVKSDLFLFGAPAHLPPAQLRSLEALAKRGQPMAFFGSLAGGIDPALLGLAGLRPQEREPEQDMQLPGTAGDERLKDIGNFPASFTTPQRLTRATAMPGTTIYRVNDVPVLVLNQRAPLNLSVWDPPELHGRCCKPLREIMGGSAAPYGFAAATLTEQLATTQALRAETIDLQQTSTVAAWKTGDGVVHLLAGNLEEGLRDDADHSRHFAMQLPHEWETLAWRSLWSGEPYRIKPGRLQFDMGPESSVLLEGAADIR
jgi:hypothetical protein